MKRILAAAVTLAFAMGALVSLQLSGVAAAQGTTSPSECPELIGSADRLVCYCPPGAAEGGPVWGSEVFTADSQLCRAAQHAGSISGEGGLIRIDARPGQDKYLGSTRNGVASSDWASYDRSFVVAGAEWPSGVTPPAGPYGCPSSGTSLANGRQSLTCRCGAEAMSQGTVWGNETYTTDSAICRAALHAGLLGPDGGLVSLRAAAGKPRYRGKTAHGVSSEDWASYPTSFEFVK
jgi:hypothetical protein